MPDARGRLETAILHLPRDVPRAVTDALAALRPAQVAKGIPLHVTLLYPWVPCGEVTARELERLRSFFAGRARFSYALTRVDVFADEFTCLVPEPQAELRACMRALWALYPAFPPYGGAHGGDAVPHATLGPAASREEAEARVADALPFACDVDEVALLEEHAPHRWRVRERFPLGRGGA